jgi:hypothetical protein
MYGKADGTVSPWLMRQGHTAIERDEEQQQVVAGNAEAQLDLTLAGLGIAQLPTWLIGHHLLAGSLVTILPEQAMPGLPIHVVWPQTKQAVPRVRALVDALADALADELADEFPDELADAPVNALADTPVATLPAADADTRHAPPGEAPRDPPAAPERAAECTARAQPGDIVPPRLT